MKRFWNKRQRIHGKRILSMVLIFALLLGLIPQSAYATSATVTMTEEEYTSEGCTITYKETSTWGNYVNADIVIENNTDSDKSLWQLSMVYNGVIDNIWNADIVSSENGIYQLAAKTYNSTIAAGQSVSFGFTAYGVDGKPAAPEQIIYVTDQTDDKETGSDNGNTGAGSGSSTEEGTTEEDGDTEDDSTSGQDYGIPEQWKGLHYALFTSGEEGISLYANTMNITGSVHTNQDFFYQGNSLSMDGVLEASKGITLKTADSEDSQQISAKIENAETIAMPDITQELFAYVKENGTVYDSNKDFNSDNIVIDTPVGVEGNATFNTTTFLGKGIFYATDSVTYNVGSLATPEDSRVFVVSENGNITLNGSDICLNAVLYAPNGCVYINGNNINLKGRIIAKQVCINGTTIGIHAGSDDFAMLDFLLKTEMEITKEGTEKENRKVVLSLDTLTDNGTLSSDDVEWFITKEGTEASDCYAIDEENSDAFHKEMIFKKAGTYTVTVSATTGSGTVTATEELVITKDLAPVAGFAMESEYYSRNEEGIATVHLEDSSFSPDGDVLDQRIWTIYYDENNDGVFEENEGSIVNSDNRTELSFETEGVGKYKVSLEVIETFTDTIPKLLDEDAYRRDDTTDMVESTCVFEVGNEAPTATLDIEKSKSADIVFTVGSADAGTLETYKEKAEALQATLEEQGIDARIDIAESSTLTAKDTFAWKEYDHYNYEDQYLPTLDKHILYEENDIKMMGYSYKAMRDFLFVADENPGKKTFEFDLQKDSTDWHSMDGAGFLFNTHIDEENDRISGYCVYINSRLIKISQIDCRLSNFRNGGYVYVQYAGKLLLSHRYDFTYEKHHLKVEADEKTISVWVDDGLEIDNFVLPDEKYGYGYGPITAHKQHSCSQQSYFTFKNITMTTQTGTSLSDIVDGYDWRPGASHYVVNLSDSSVPELSTNEELADLAAALIANDATFIGIGNDQNEDQYKALLNAIETEGLYLASSDMETTMDKTNGYITDSILAKDYTVGDYITTDDIVTYKGYYQDVENDELYEQQWEYEYDPTVFGAFEGETEHITRNESEPITVFEDTGAYAIRLKVRDNPVGENDALDSYRLWSETKEYEKLLVVQSRPIADVSVEVSENPSDSTTCITNVTYDANDPDHPADATQGIREEYFWYKNVKDADWTEGKLPNKLIVGETYLVKYQVRDVEGTLSFPATAAVKTRDFLVYEEMEDLIAPEVFINVPKQEIEVGEQIYIDAYATDDYGVDTFEVTVDGKRLAESYGRLLLTGQEEGTVTIKAIATDIGGNTATKEVTIKVVDNRDKTAPVAEITAPSAGSEIGFNVQIKGSAKDETELAKYTLSYKEQREEEYHVFHESTNPVSDDILGSLDITEFADGTYEILLTAEDTAGNIAYYGILLYIETGVTKGYTVKGELADVQLSVDGSQIEVAGTATAQGHMQRYTLSYQMNGEGEPVLIEEGTTEVENGILGTIPTEGLKTGLYNLILTVEDIDGNSGTACGAFEYEEGQTEIETDLIAPHAEVTGLKLSDDGSTVNIRATAKDDKELKGYALSYAKEGSDEYSELATGEEAIEDILVYALPTEVLEDGTYVLKLQAWDACGNSTTYTITFTYKAGGSFETGTGNETETPVPGEPVAKDFAIALSHSVANLGTEVQAQVTLPDNVSEESVTITMNGKELATGTRKTTFTSDETGRMEITATGMTDEGEEISATAYCTFYKLTDKNPPTAAITSPTIDQVLSKPVDIVGSVEDAEGLDFWKLEYRMKGDTDYQLLAEGTEEKKDEVLAHFDTTMLLNGQYEVRLTVQDEGGNITKATNDYVVEGELKVGAMHIGFTDINSNVVGIPMHVTRTYDSRNKKQGDFGIGWTLGMDDLSIRLMNDFYDGWEMTKTGSLFTTAYSLYETKPHDIVITYGDGSSDRFEVQLNKSYQPYVPIYLTKIEFKCVTNPKLKLEISGGNEYSTTGMIGETYLFGEDSDIMENPQRYILTLEDNTKVYIHIKNGLEKMVDPSGNTVTFTEKGYEHSDGKGITFDRDAKGRITKATDSSGNYKVYQYDDAGNLSSVTDQADRTVSYEYDNKHNLTNIIDPNGVATARYIYGEDGRLVATVDGEGNRVEYDYNVDDKIQIVKDELGGTTVYSYDDNGNILTKTDALGNKYAYEYDTDNNVIAETDPLNRTTRYTYDESGNRTETILPDGTIIESSFTTANLVIGIQTDNKVLMTLEYDEIQNVTSVTNGEGDETTYEYNDKGQFRSVTDEIGLYMRYTYDDDGNVRSMVNGSGEKTTMTYDESGNCISATITETVDGVENSYVKKFEYDEAGNLITSIDPENGITTYEYDALGNQTASVDAEGNRTTYTYDNAGNMTQIVYPDGTTEAFTYDAAGNTLTATDRNGLTVTMEYDKLSRMTKKTDATGYSIAYEYDACGNLLSETTSSGAVTSYTYDNRNRNIAVTDAYGNVTKYTYTETSQVETMTNALGNVITYKYDGCDNCVEVIYPDGSSVESEYDQRGRLVKQKDQEGSKTEYTYNGADQLTQVTDPEGNITRYTYNSTGELVMVTDAMGHDTKYEYDGNSRLVKTILANGACSENRYDAMGNLTEQIAYDGTKTEYSYDNCGRLLNKSVNGVKTTYSYDNKFRLTEVTNAEGTVKYVYDIYGRLLSKIDTNNVRIGYSYDKAGRMTSVKTEYGTTQYEYDLLDRMTKVIDRNGNATVYEYDALGNRTAVRYPNGTVMSYTYDVCSRLKEEWLTDKDGNTLSGYVYTLDKEGKRTKIEETRADGSEVVIKYEYDKLDRLTEESIKKDWDKITNQYEYNEVSNRTVKKTSITGDVEQLADVSSGIASSVVEGTTEYTYNMLNQLICERIGTGLREYSYDENGNQVKMTSTISGDKQADYVYNDEGRLEVATLQVGNEVTITRYGYDYEGNRAWSQTNEQDKVYFVTDTTGLSMVLAETDEEGTEKAYYTIGEDRISMSKDSGVWYYGYDGHGDTRLLTDEEGVVTDTYSYDAWGNQLTKTGSTSNDYLYAGECLDANTGLYYLRARYMNPANGLFISMDSYQGNIYEPVTLHKYLYANANPVKYTDPTGYVGRITDTALGMTIENMLRTAYSTPCKKAMAMLNVAATCYSTTRRTVTSLLEGTKISQLVGEWISGVVFSALVGGLMSMACFSSKPFVIVMSVVFSMLAVGQFVKDFENGDIDLAIADLMLLACSIGAIFMKCFTGDTLVDTVEGYKRIDEIQVGDYVWAEDIVTGKKELKKVLKVYVKETDHLIHIGTSTGEDIETTENHPFYIDGRGWVAASEIEEGDKIHTADGEVVIVIYNKEEWLSETIKVYNLEVADVHTYFVTTDKVLVHNKYDADVNEKTVVNSAGKEVTRTYVKDQDALLNAAEEAAGGDLDDFIEIKPGWYENLEKTMKIEWNPEGHANTNEGPHVTVRVKNEKGSWSVVDKFFIEGWDFYK